MENIQYSLKIDLKKLTKAFVKDIQGTEKTVQCLCIPIQENELFVSSKGAVYVDLIAIPSPNNAYGCTHLIKKKVKKEVYKALKDGERLDAPILGNVKPLVSIKNDDPQDAQKKYGNNFVSSDYGNNDDDMPF